jgi:hypothetical protein
MVVVRVLGPNGHPHLWQAVAAPEWGLAPSASSLEELCEQLLDRKLQLLCNRLSEPLHVCN